MKYVLNMEYELICIVDSRGGISIQPLNPKQLGQFCKYESMVSFLNNWDGVYIKKPKRE